MSGTPEVRVRPGNGAEVRGEGEFVLYWMIACRRTTWNFGLQRAVEWATDLRKPLVILEALRTGYRWASDRLHRFVIDGMADNARRLRNRPVTYLPYVEATPNAGAGLLEALARNACLVVTDDFPCFFLPKMTAAAAQAMPVRIEMVDSNGLFPLRAARQAYPSAYSFRRFLQKNLREHLDSMPRADPLLGVSLPRLKQIPEAITRRWPSASASLLRGSSAEFAALPIDHTVSPAPIAGGSSEAQAALDDFLRERLPRYLTDGNHPDDDVRSGLSPYLHFGHISSHEVFHRLVEQERWSPASLSAKANGKRAGWWGVGPAAEAFLDELITWRELGYYFCAQRDDYDQYDSLPDWARKTLAKHARDRRSHVYALDRFAQARTHDPVWNAAQTQLVREGRMHNYLRMLWGKKILEWSPTPREALATMIELNNKYALDGRDPNSYSGIFWVLGRYDRPWGPERPIFGAVRYMSSANTVRKLRIKNYLARYSPTIEDESR